MKVEVTPYFWIPEHKTSITGVEVITPAGYQRGERVIFNVPEEIAKTGPIFPYHICDYLYDIDIDPSKIQVKCEDKELSGTYVWESNKWGKEDTNA